MRPVFELLNMNFNPLERGWSIIFEIVIVPLKEGENIERALKKFKRKFEKTGVIKELRDRQAFTKPSIRNRMARMKAAYRQSLQQAEE